ncbi:MAG TPA: 2Fe-2S iron-sulfur cluster-binding protein [Planctomycetota bacterium]|nr:2Fe-2S iron-sulfur cluster-binding protein [Planctomycetota bacterium]
MPTMTIDGRKLEFAPGRTIIEVAHAAGIEVPHYCYHPGLSVAGNCRVCMVEVEKNPRPQIACYVQAQDGMVVSTQSALAREARASVMQMLLVNHPLDCPICDQAGECKLQDYAFEFGAPTAATPVEKTHGRKNVPFGEKIVYDMERCIKCTRCVRFTDEVTRSHELSMGSRSDHEEVIMTSRGEFTTPYAMNIIDLCPVGALTSKDFRFESRVWFMDFTESVCTGCARGCNVTIGSRGGRFLRMTPRENQDVNRWWMCDPGRLGFKFVNSPTRLATPMARRGPGATDWAPVTWDEGIALAADALRGAGRGGVLADAGLTIEELHLLGRIASVLRPGDLRYASRVGTDEDGFLIVNEKGANQRGAELLGWKRATAPAPAAILAVERGENVPEALRVGADAPVVLATDRRDVPATARVAFPLATWAEKDGFLVNVDGIVQPVRRARSAGPPGAWQPFELLEELRLAVDTTAEPLGREGVLAAVRALPAFAGVAFPDVVFGPAPAATVAAPATRTR